MSASWHEADGRMLPFELAGLITAARGVNALDDDTMVKRAELHAILRSSLNVGIGWRSTRSSVSVRVAYFGWRCDFGRSRFEPTEPIPDFLLELRSRAARFAGLRGDDLPHALVTEYASGVEIGWRRDRPVFEDVIGISLGSECTFRYRHKAGSKWERYALSAVPRSVYLMRGASRWDWEHSIPAVRDLRYSVTFRSLSQRQPLRPAVPR